MIIDNRERRELVVAHLTVLLTDAQQVKHAENFCYFYRDFILLPCRQRRAVPDVA